MYNNALSASIIGQAFPKSPKGEIFTNLSTLEIVSFKTNKSGSQGGGSIQNVFFRINRHAIHPYFIMKMRAGGLAGIANRADNILSFD